VTSTANSQTIPYSEHSERALKSLGHDKLKKISKQENDSASQLSNFCKTTESLSCDGVFLWNVYTESSFFVLHYLHVNRRRNGMFGSACGKQWKRVNTEENVGNVKGFSSGIVPSKTGALLD
jgi:hypothetical protein